MLSTTTTTDVQSSDTSEENSQLEAAVDTTAAEADTTQTQTDPSGTDESAEATAETDENLTWLQKKANIDPSDPEALRKAAEVWRKADQNFHQAAQEAKNELHTATQTAADGDDNAQLKSSVQVLQFYTFNPEARELDAEMAQIVTDKPWLAQDLDTVLTLAKASKSADAVKQAEIRGREQAKADIAKASTAGTPKGNASGARADKSDDEARLERFSTDW